MNILLGVTGSISAYKACDIVSGLVATGHEVQVVMTDDAKKFIPEMPLAILSKREVLSSFDDEAKGEVMHITKAHWADIFLIAPATANTIAKVHHGIADNVLTAMALAFRGIKIIAPAMNTNMLESNPMQRSLKKLPEDGWDILETQCGILACGDSGLGKLAKPRHIVAYVNLRIDEINKAEILAIVK